MVGAIPLVEYHQHWTPSLSVITGHPHCIVSCLPLGLSLRWQWPCHYTHSYAQMRTCIWKHLHWCWAYIFASASLSVHRWRNCVWGKWLSISLAHSHLLHRIYSWAWPKHKRLWCMNFRSIIIHCRQGGTFIHLMTDFCAQAPMCTNGCRLVSNLLLSCFHNCPYAPKALIVVCRAYVNLGCCLLCLHYTTVFAFCDCIYALLFLQRSPVEDGDCVTVLCTAHQPNHFS